MLDTLNNWKLTKKIFVGFAFIAALVSGLAINGVSANAKIHDIAVIHYHRGIEGTGALSDVLGYLREYRIIIYSHMTAQSMEERAKLEERFAKNKADINEAVKAYSQIAVGAIGDHADAEIDESWEPEVAKLQANVAALNDVNQQIIEQSRRSGFDGTIALVKGEGKEASHAALSQAKLLMDKTKEEAESRDDAGDAYVDSAMLMAVVIALLAMGGLGLVWWLMSKTVAAPMAALSGATKTLAEGGKADVPSRDRGDELGEIAKAVELFRKAGVERAEADARVAAEQKVVTSALGEGLDALTSGDLTADIKADFPGGYAQLKANFNDAVVRLREMIGQVTESADAIRTGSDEIAQASEDLARRTEANAASLEETSAALVQIDGRLKATAGAAGETVKRADQAIATVSGGRSTAVEAVQAMDRVRGSAKGIDEVIEGVDKIAFQTRVLAMNAAVEAGRAGEAGRGFAVVADLVSALAMRAEEEAKKARDQLTVTQSDIVTAVEAVQKVDAALGAISGDVGEVHVLLGNMASDNQAQSSAITQISVAIGTMDQSTQQNAAMVEETSAAARNLSSEVASLSEQAAQFNTGSERSRAARKTIPVKLPQPAGKAPAYVSPVKALPTQGNAAVAVEEWNDF